MSDHQNPPIAETTVDSPHLAITFTEIHSLPVSRDELLVDIWLRGAWDELVEIQSDWKKVAKTLSTAPVPKSD